MTGEPALAMWLYGSHARGDADEFSDIDVLVISDVEAVEPPTRRLLGTSTEPSASRYSWDEIGRMAAYGSLFLHHVKSEGRPVFESDSVTGRLDSILGRLGPYQLAGRDVMAFQTVLADARESLDSGEASLFFELSTLATLFRHASVLSCSVAARPCFARTQPVTRLVDLWNLSDEWADEFPSLYSFRMYAESRLTAVPSPCTSLAYVWCERSDALLDELSRRIDGSG